MTDNQSIDESEIRLIFEYAHTIAVVGLSDEPGRPSHRVAAYLRRKGYHIIPVNPTIGWVMGEKAYPTLLHVTEPVDVVLIFRRSEDVPPHVDEAIRIGAKVIWMQEGIVNEPAAEKARAAGITVIMNQCMMTRHRQLFRA